MALEHVLQSLLMKMRMSSIWSHEFVPIRRPAASENEALIDTPALRAEPLFVNLASLHRRFRSTEQFNVGSSLTSNSKLNSPFQLRPKLRTREGDSVEHNELHMYIHIP